MEPVSFNECRITVNNVNKSNSKGFTDGKDSFREDFMRANIMYIEIQQICEKIGTYQMGLISN